MSHWALWVGSVWLATSLRSSSCWGALTAESPVAGTDNTSGRAELLGRSEWHVSYRESHTPRDLQGTALEITEAELFQSLDQRGFKTVSPEELFEPKTRNRGQGRETIRKILVSVKFLTPAILGPEMAAPILWAPGSFVFFVLENLHAHKIPRLWGGGGGFGFFFGGGGGGADLLLWALAFSETRKRH